MILLSYAIIKEECECHGIDAGMLLSHRTGGTLPAIRRIIIARLHRELGMGPSAIGRAMNRDHSSICHALKIIKNTSPATANLPTGMAKKAATASRHPDRAKAVAATYGGRKPTDIWLNEMVSAHGTA